jgi:hypothetical protein
LETSIGSHPGAGQVLWTPPADARKTTEIGRYLQWLEHAQQMSFDGYDALWRWSVEDQRGGEPSPMSRWSRSASARRHVCSRHRTGEPMKR